MKARNKNISGYKRTKDGWIPEDWEYLPQSEGIFLKSGQHINAKYCSDIPNGIPYLTGPICFKNGEIIQYTYTTNPQKMCCKNDILVTVKGSGTGEIARADKAYCISRQLMAVRTESWSQDFLFYRFLVDSQRYQSLSDGLIPGISREDILTNCIPLPPISEQRKIAKILSTWDESIQQMRKLIEAKKSRMKALMQQLLTGKRRLSGFGKPWREYLLGDLFNERIETNHHHLSLLAITGSRGVIPASEIERKDSSTADKSKYKRIAPGDIGYNTMRMWQGVSAVSSLEGIVSPAYTVCIPKKGIDAWFMGYLFKFPPVVHLFRRYSQGLVSDTLNLKFLNFAKIRVRIPSLDEQRLIRKVLSAADEAIETLETKLSALAKQKRGLMQKLLTGEVRVKP